MTKVVFYRCFFFFFQAEDGIRDHCVTGVQTCALPISAPRARVENVGVLAASGLIAGEALAGLVTGWFNYKEGKLPAIFEHPSYLAGVGVMALIALVLIKVPLRSEERRVGKGVESAGWR